jgi:muramoyltetrapeptide carboxypeptidase
MWLLPPALRPGARVRVIAPAGPFEPPLVWRGLGWLSERYDVRFTRRIFARHGYLAGDDQSRRAELAAALCEDVDAIVCDRGGYGATRIADAIAWDALADRPRWIVGFSDVTALHVEAWRVGVASLHAHNVGGLGRGDARARQEWIAQLEAPRRQRTWSGLATVFPGQATAPMVGGNLTLLHACAAADRLLLPQACILLLEDVSEAPYRLDRALTSLRSAGVLGAVAGVVLGEFTSCDAGRDGVTVAAVMRDRLGDVGVPVVAGAPVGHGRRNEPFVCGAPVTLTADATGGSVHFW